VLYCNDGDWVESLTALVEHVDGRLEILDWSTRGHPGKRTEPEQEELAAQPGVRAPELALLSKVMATH